MAVNLLCNARGAVFPEVNALNARLSATSSNPSNPSNPAAQTVHVGALPCAIPATITLRYSTPDTHKARKFIALPPLMYQPGCLGTTGQSLKGHSEIELVEPAKEHSTACLAMI